MLEVSWYGEPTNGYGIRQGKHWFTFAYPTREVAERIKQNILECNDLDFNVNFSASHVPILSTLTMEDIARKES